VGLALRVRLADLVSRQPRAHRTKPSR